MEYGKRLLQLESKLNSIRTRVKRAFESFALRAVNRSLQRNGLHLYRYVPNTDRLFPYHNLNSRRLRSNSQAEIDADAWFRVLSQRKLSVDVAFDVGVNYGYTTTWMSRWARKVYAFEPNRRNIAMIREHLAIRQVDNAELIESAIADHEGRATLYVKDQDGHHSLGDIGASPTTSTQEVTVTTLDRVAQERGIDRVGFLKIDVEGYEAEVLEGARTLLGTRAIDLILFEYSPYFYRQRGLDPAAPLTVLRRFGYQITTLAGAPIDAAITLAGQVDLFAEPSKA